MKKFLQVLSAAIFTLIVSEASAETFLVKDGQPQAQIVIAEDSPRMVGLAAEELQIYLEKISGAELPIVNEATEAYPNSIYVGRSAFTEELGITDEGLDHGAFKMISGPDYLVLFGRDFDYESKALTQEEWEEAAGATWSNPVQEDLEKHAFNSEAGVWHLDEGGSLNAVYEFLRTLGVRWYMQHALGEVIPKVASIELPEVDETVHPDYPLRYWFVYRNFGKYPREVALFDRRVGLGSRLEALGNGNLTHGLAKVLESEELKKEHPEYYALMDDGSRDTFSRGKGHACMSSDGLVEEAANYVRAVYDIYDEPIVQLSPPDGFRHCQCEECRDMTASDNVFGFLNRVAKEVYKTHPNRILLGAAYTYYQEPPENIEEFSPNFAVSINNVGRPGFVFPEYWDSYQELIKKWEALLGPQRVLRVENTRYGSNPIPTIHPRSIAKDLRAMNSVSLGERNEVLGNREFPGGTHLNLYAMGRYYWDSDQDIEDLLTEYYDLFYGPAAAEMREAFDFAENNPVLGRDFGKQQSWFERRKEGLERQLTFWELVRKAREKAGDSIYGERIDILLSEASEPVEEIRAALTELEEKGDPRAEAPLVLAAASKSGTEPEVYRLEHVHPEGKPDMETTFSVVQEGDDLVFDIFCEEKDMENLNASEVVWNGDSVAILLETPFHSHYQIEVNPDGKVYDRVWKADEGEQWVSQAQVESERGEDYWKVQVRIPIADVAAGEGDPRHYVVGEMPTLQKPWYFNLGRSRVRGEDKQFFVFSPFSGGKFHDPEKFGRLAVE